MKVEVDVDLNKINYDKIEEAIMKRLEGDELSSILAISYYTKDNMRAVVERKINEELDNAVTKWTNASPDRRLEEIINDILKEVIRDICQERVKAVIEKMGGESKIEEIAHSLLGNMFAAAFYDHVQQIVYTSSITYGERQSERCRNEAKNMIENAFYQSGFPVPSV